MTLPQHVQDDQDPSKKCKMTNGSAEEHVTKLDAFWSDVCHVVNSRGKDNQVEWYVFLMQSFSE